MQESQPIDGEKFYAPVPLAPPPESAKSEAWVEKFVKKWNMMDVADEGQALVAFRKVKEELAKIGITFNVILERANEVTRNDGKLDEALAANAGFGEQNKLLKRENDLLRAENERLKFHKVFKNVASELFSYGPEAAVAGVTFALCKTGLIGWPSALFLGGIVEAITSAARLVDNKDFSHARKFVGGLIVVGGFATFACGLWNEAEDDTTVNNGIIEHIRDMEQEGQIGPETFAIKQPHVGTTMLVTILGDKKELTYTINQSSTADIHFHDKNADNKKTVTCTRYWYSKKLAPKRPDLPNTSGSPSDSAGDCTLYNQLTNN